MSPISTLRLRHILGRESWVLLRARFIPSVLRTPACAHYLPRFSASLENPLLNILVTFCHIFPPSPLDAALHPPDRTVISDPLRSWCRQDKRGDVVCPDFLEGTRTFTRTCGHHADCINSKAISCHTFRMCQTLFTD